ncbi:MAG: prepilin-type N-terminal cleavage/methylation domain-containing protein [Candidatus Sumerlaeia bacterium]|nr:prepilin-type N-terminal cleavage/methylation domain-containing protein [Candidatus Sumerlaeia bacterium]
MKKAFTLIELLIVVAIIAILAAIAVPNFLEAQTRAKVSRAVSDMRTLATALESYYVDNNKYPPFALGPGTLTTCPGSTSTTGNSVLGVRTATGAPQCAISSRQTWITTPISYITSLFPEAFSVKSAALSANGGTENPLEYDTYDYIDAFSFSPSGRIPRTPAQPRSGRALTSGGAWRLASAGPDLAQNYGGVDLAAGISALANRDGADYDPTNGTVSVGDIVRTGGGQGILVAGEPFYDRVGNTLRRSGP